MTGGTSRRAASLIVCACGALAAALPARADSQFSASATLESQYRLRGVALTDDDPDLRLEFSYDHASGGYVGAALIGGRTFEQAFRALGFVAYLGYAQKSGNGVTWDFGATISEINLYLRPIPYTSASYPAYQAPATGYPAAPEGSAPGTFHYRADYAELYGGWAWRDTSARLYVSPDYLGQSLRTLYLDLTQSYRPLTHVRLFAHVGVLTPLDGTGSPGSGREHYDASAGAAYEFLHGELQLAWVGLTPQVQYPTGYPQKRSALLASVTGFF
jgi:Bacterial protein of unknown function (Gcw_chp)